MPTNLFDLREADALLEASRDAEPATALQTYRQHKLKLEREPLCMVTCMALVRTLPILRLAFNGGESVVNCLDAFSVDLFLTTNSGDAQRVIDSGLCAGALLKRPSHEGQLQPEIQVRIGFAGDTVLFANSIDVAYNQKWLDTLSLRFTAADRMQAG